MTSELQVMHHYITLLAFSSYVLSFNQSQIVL
jgi:hypothetical protein